MRDTVAKGGRILFVGTKRQAQKPIAEAAEKCAQFYMNHRWLGGTLTNWKTVSQSIQRLKQIDELMAHGAEGLTKKERLDMEREQTKLQASLGGIREMGGTPDLIFIIDVGKEDLAILEAQKLGIPVIGVVDTNCSPKGVDFVIPGNDDAARAIALYCDLMARAALDGMPPRWARPVSILARWKKRPKKKPSPKPPPRPEASLRTLVTRRGYAPPGIPDDMRRAEMAITAQMVKELREFHRRRHDGREKGVGRNRRRHGSCR